MARPSKNSEINYKVAHDLTTGLLERAACPDGLPFVLLKDSDKTGLRLRVTKAGGKHWQFETRVKSKLFTRALGEWPTVPIGDARQEAHRLRGLTEKGTDPRDIERQQEQAQAAAIEAQASEQRQKAQEHAANALTVSEAWSRYTTERSDTEKQNHWGALTIRDHDVLAQVGGIERERRPGVLTKAGPLAELMPLRLIDLTAPTIEAWAKKEAKDRPARVRSALRLLKAFLRWAASEPDLKGKVDPTAASSKKAREVAGKAKQKNDYIQREQLSNWFTHVRQIQNPVISAYLQCLLLTGARREELAALKWVDVNFQWKGIDLKDKIEGRRAVPLTPFVAHLLAGLPKRNEWVFSSPTSASGGLKEPSIAHRKACTAAGLELTLHGLRRSFASLCEWLDIPGGISAQIQGHAPQGVREQNYIRRPLDLLRVHHEKIEAWILEQAGVTFDAAVEPGKLRVVA